MRLFPGSAGNFKKLAVSVFACAGILAAEGCLDSAATKAGSPPSDGSGTLSVKMAVPRVNDLSKASLITLNKLIVVLTSNGTTPDTLRDTLTSGTVPALNTLSTADQTLGKNYKVKALRAWKVVATVRDARDSVIHRDSASSGTTFLPAADTLHLSLNLSPRFSMYDAVFDSLPDSVSSSTGSAKQALNISRLVLKIDGVTLRDSSRTYFAPKSRQTLSYDYVSAGRGLWAAVNSGTPRKLYAVQFPTVDTGYIAGDTVVLRSVDAGQTWTPAAAVPRSMRYLSFASGSNGVLGGDSATMARTTSAGGGWTFQKLSNFTPVASPVYMVNDTGFALSNTSTLNGGSAYRTTEDGGATWQTRSVYANNMYALSCVGTANCWAAGYAGAIRKSAGYGDYFGTPESSGTARTLNGLAFYNAGTGWAVGDTGTILKTSDGGTTWAPQNSGTTRNLRAVYFLDVNQGFAVGDAGTVLSTINGGATWTAQTSGTSRNLNGLSFSGSKGFAVGDGGTILSLSDVHRVQMLMYGVMNGWNAANPLFSGTAFVNGAAGVDASVNMNLTWLGPTTGTVTTTVTIGKVGKVIVSGTSSGIGAIP